MGAKLLYLVNENFFKNWNNEMAYILGFTFADGSLLKNTVAWEIQKRDRRILEKINASMNSNYPIKLTKEGKYIRLRISNPFVIRNLRRFNIEIKKHREFPNVPVEYLSHFIRGFLDGDGWVYIRHSRSEICIGFASSSYVFLKALVKRLNEMFKLSANNLRKKMKTTKNGKPSICYQVDWYNRNAIKIIEFLYDDVSKESLCLDRKFDKHMVAIETFQKMKRDVTKRDVEEKFEYPLKKILTNLLYEKEMKVPQIAENISVKPSTVYEWLKMSKIELPRREKRCLISKCLNCGVQFKTHRLSKKYCSIECFHASMHTGRAVSCTVCNKQVYRPLWWFKVNRYPLCSIDCERKWKKMLLERGLIQRDDNTGRFLNSNNSVM